VGPGLIVHNRRLLPLLREPVTDADLDSIEALLGGWGVEHLPARANGLYSAVSRRLPGVPETGYDKVWVRDCVHVAQCAWERGEVGAAAQTARTLLTWFVRQADRFEGCIDGGADRDDPMQRPHVRFDGDTLSEIDVWWPHAQNDALGYGLWFCARAALAGLLPLNEQGAAAMLRFPRYFAAMRYWEDEDSGHWEEHRKLNASSVGTVLAGLLALRGLVRSRPELLSTARGQSLELPDLDQLIASGRSTLDRLLPSESVARDGTLVRDTDAALLFLIHPLRVVRGEMADRILERVRRDLVGPIGVKRYVGDSYWMADYKTLYDEATRTAGFGPDLASRDAQLKPGTEAQWCLFDPVLSVIHGWRYLASRDPAELSLQVHHFHRALAQVTGADCRLGEGLCPEAYYLPDSTDTGSWEPNDDTPLLWVSAYLGAALRGVRNSLGVAPQV
jgi:phosphorylase kinase alpha/beta subunit